jgi:hypothetical protein
MASLCGMSSCKKDKSPASTSIIGKWRWVKSIGGIAGSTVTPKSTGYNLSEEFKADSTYKFFKNDSLIAQGKFSIVRNYKYSSTETVDLLKMGFSSDDAFTIRNDTLFTNNILISDGFNTIYVRVK